MGFAWDWLMDMYVISVVSNCMYVGVGLQFVACQVGPGISCQGIACQVWTRHQLPGLPSESFPTDLSKHAKFFLWFLNSHFLGGWVPDPPPQKVRINSDNGNFSDAFPETAQIPLARKPY